MKENNQSFRRRDRKVIAESKAERDSRRASQSQEELLGGIHDKLDDVQTSSDITGEAVENKSNQIIDSLNSGLGDVVAATELTAEAVENTTSQVRKLTDVASQISEKLSQLTTALENKLSPVAQSTSASTTPSGSTALAVISETIPDIQTDQERISDALDQLIPRLENPNQDADFFDDPAPQPAPQPQQENNPPAPAKREEDDKGKGGKGLSDQIGQLIKITKDGFKTSIGFSDKISSMLFKYTVTAAIEAAKTAAMILSLVLAIDVIRVNFNYWAKLFETNFNEFSKKAEEWGPLIGDIVTAVNQVKEAWDKNDWSGLTISIVKGVAKAVVNLAELVVLGISKLAASILRSVGADEKALNLEGDALETFQAHTGAKLNDEDANTLAEYQVKKMNENKKNEDDHPVYYDAGDKIKLATGQMTMDEYNKRKADRESGNKDPFYSMSHDDQIKAIKARNDANASIDRTNDYLDNADPENSNFSKSAEGALTEVQKTLNSNELKNAPELRAELQSKYDDLNKKYQALTSKKSAVSPESSTESPDNKVIERIDNAKTEKTQTAPAAGNNVQVNNVSKKSTNHFTLPTQTATLAPGTYSHASKVN